MLVITLSIHSSNAVTLAYTPRPLQPEKPKLTTPLRKNCPVLGSFWTNGPPLSPWHESLARVIIPAQIWVAVGIPDLVQTVGLCMIILNLIRKYYRSIYVKFFYNKKVIFWILLNFEKENKYNFWFSSLNKHEVKFIKTR